MRSSSSSRQEGIPAPIVHALEKSRGTAEELKRAAEELAMVHAVIDTQVHPPARSEEVDKAVAQTKEIEHRLGNATEALHEVNATLEQTIKSKPST